MQQYMEQKMCKLHVCVNEDSDLISCTECEEFGEFPLQIIKDKQNNISNNKKDMFAQTAETELIKNEITVHNSQLYIIYVIKRYNLC